MKATIEIPDELYRQVKAKSALAGQTIREVTEELYRRYVQGLEPVGQSDDAASEPGPLLDGEPTPSWFGALRHRARTTPRHDMESIRASIARGRARDRDQ